MTGYFKDANDVASLRYTGPRCPGRFKYADINKDGVIDPNDRKFLGSPIPKATYGLNLTVAWKAFSLNAFFYGKYGNKIANFSKWYNNFYQSFSDAALGTNVLNAWSTEHPKRSEDPHPRNSVQLQHQHGGELMVPGKRFIPQVEEPSGELQYPV